MTARGPQKAMVFLDNCCHNAFNSAWWVADGHDSSDPRLASEADHQSLAIDYIGDLFRWQLNGELLGARFNGGKPNRGPARQRAMDVRAEPQPRPKASAPTGTLSPSVSPPRSSAHEPPGGLICEYQRAA
jgi:hypothetical protein